jgi:hypothetical protein
MKKISIGMKVFFVNISGKIQKGIITHVNCGKKNILGVNYHTIRGIKKNGEIDWDYIREKKDIFRSRISYYIFRNK